MIRERKKGRERVESREKMKREKGVNSKEGEESAKKKKKEARGEGGMCVVCRCIVMIRENRLSEPLASCHTTLFVGPSFSSSLSRP